MRRKIPPASGLSSPPQQIKNPNSLKGGIEDCTRLAWSSSRRPARVARVPSVHPTGRSSGSWINLLPAPSRGVPPPQWLQPVSSPITAAGPRRICTVFPFTCKCFYLIPFRPGGQGQAPPGRTRKRLRPPPGPGPQVGIWPGGGTRPGGRPDDSWSRSVPCPWPR